MRRALRNSLLEQLRLNEFDTLSEINLNFKFMHTAAFNTLLIQTHRTGVIRRAEKFLPKVFWPMQPLQVQAALDKRVAEECKKREIKKIKNSRYCLLTQWTPYYGERDATRKLFAVDRQQRSATSLHLA